jgi:hypothetical protein
MADLLRQQDDPDRAFLASAGDAGDDAALVHAAPAAAVMTLLPPAP